MVTTYRLIRKLGEGQFGEVFLAEAPGGHEVAVKRMLTRLDEDACRRELQALEVLRRLRHPFLMEIHASWVQENRLHIAMQLADGSLAERFAECKKAGLPGIPRDELISYFAELAEALDYLHEHGVMHRDIKPANLLLHRGHAKVADLGLARHLSPNEVAGTFCGTPAFMGPEVFSGEVSFPADQYSLACSYVEMRRGDPPYSGRTAFVLAQQVFNEEPDLKRIPPAEQQVLLRALAKEPKDRFPNCVEFVNALRASAVPRPKPPAPPWQGFALVAAVILLLAALLLVVFFPGLFSAISTPRGSTTGPRAAAPWLPPGFASAEGEQTPVTIDGQPFWRSLVTLDKFQDAPITFVFIQGKDAAHCFYISREKITVQQFSIALADKEMRDLLRQAADKNAAYVAHPEWLDNDKVVPPPEDKKRRWPKDGVTVPEAYCFAQYVSWKHGNLPSLAQWDRAAHHPPDDFPYDKEGWEKAAWEGIAVRGVRLDSGGSKYDVCKATGCRDLGGNGRELTRTLSRPDMEFPFHVDPKKSSVYIRGAGWNEEDPFSYPRQPPGELGYIDGPNHTGYSCFRVVLEPVPGLFPASAD
jgi:serine/threonine protein kinase